MKIIDFEKKGNVVRFYLGDDNCTDYWGDDWDDIPYESNAGMVYQEYIKGYTDISFPFGSLVLEPCDDYDGSEYSKEDMVARRVPCIIEVSFVEQGLSNIFDWSLNDKFSYWVAGDRVKKYYFGDKMEPQVVL